MSCQVWELGNYDGPVKDLSVGEGFTPTVLVHPPTYLNKVSVCSLKSNLKMGLNLGFVLVRVCTKGTKSLR